MGRIVSSLFFFFFWLFLDPPIFSSFVLEVLRFGGIGESENTNLGLGLICGCV